MTATAPLHLDFSSDNVAGASSPVLDALVAANAAPLPAYGADGLTREVAARLAAVFEREVSVFLVATGTAANALALAAMLSPWGACLCHAEAHVMEDECGAPEFFSHGAKLLGIDGVGGRIEAGALAARLDGLPRADKQMPPQAVTISQATEAGLVYRPDAIAAISAVCRARGLKLHMDGARFANALVAMGVSPADLTWRAGIDILSFGGTKNGCLAAEAVVVFDPGLAETLRFRRKRSGHTLSKGRLLAAQYLGYLAGDHWLDNARHANAMAEMLAAGFADRGIPLAWPREVNEVFAFLPERIDDALRAAGAAFHPWSSEALDPGRPLPAGHRFVRLVTSFATRPEEVAALLDLMPG